ncbi:MAG: acetyl-CoA C-acetyltransferase [Geobacteraceae bacterium]|nr:acetyl-CoA C-acetyltransferase [Geobacteraceae bacterium]
MADPGAYRGGRPVYIVDGMRTPFLKARGTPGPFRAADLAVAAGRALLLRQPFAPEELDEVILGCIIPGPDEANIGRVVSLRLGCGKRVPAWTVQRNCGSGMEAVDAAAMNIAHGRAELVLAGGTEAMSHAPLLLNDEMAELLGEWGRAKSSGERLSLLGRLRPGHFRPVIALLRGLTDPVAGLSMGQTAEILAHRFRISRERMDGYALESHLRLARARDEGRLAEIAVICDSAGNYYDHDEGVRRDTEMAGLARLRPAFEPPFGLVTAGNSAQVTDGAAWLLLASAEAVGRYRLPVLGRIADCHWAGVEPAEMGLGPVHAMAPILARQGLDVADVDYWEINEAFAAQVLACLAAWQSPEYCREELGLAGPLPPIDPERLNVDGGAVAIGHPVGTSGARIVLHLCHVLARENARRGMASLCIGGGQGGAMLIERGEGVPHGA